MAQDSTTVALETPRSLTASRGVLKGRLTRILHHLESISAGQTADPDELLARKTLAAEIFNDFQSIQQAIETANPAEAQTDERENFEERYVQTLTLINRLSREPHSFSPTVTPSSPVPGAGGHSRVQLPTINLPSFSGQYDEWIPFRDTFQSLIHGDPSLSEVQKLFYLRSALSGPALGLLAALEVSADNYEVARSLLYERYNDNKALIQKHFSGLLEGPKVERGSASSLRNLLDNTQKHLRALQSLKQSTGNWGPILVHILASKLDNTSRSEWEVKTHSIEQPTYDDFTTFLSSRSRMLEICQARAGAEVQKPSNVRPIPNPRQSRVKPQGPRATFLSTHTENPTTTHSDSCLACDQRHAVYGCSNFLKLTPKERVALTKQKQACFNCLRTGHLTLQCKSGGCRKCGSKHNTLLHIEPQSNTGTSSSSTLTACSQCLHQTTEVVLATATLLIQDSSGKFLPCRALLDSASQSNLITDSLACSLGLAQQRGTLTIIGVSSEPTVSTYSITTRIKATQGGFQGEITLHSLKLISSNLPNTKFCTRDWEIPGDLVLADKHFNSPSKIDMLIGAQFFWQLICTGQIRLPNQVTLQNTRLGWVVSGAIQRPQARKASRCYIAKADDSLNNSLARFWELEEASSPTKRLNADELQCEEHFAATTVRHHDGRFVVHMPLKHEVAQLGNSHSSALTRFHSLENRLNKNPALKQDYLEFLTDYLEQDHMAPVNTTNDNGGFYLPHHPVVKETSLTTKTRIVFDGSAPSTSNYSLNDIQLVGPTVQRELMSILLNFRMYQFVYAADIRQMYRQILLHPSQHKLQQILWRNNPDEPIQTYQLKTVTYGLASSPYLATRCLHQLSLDGQETHPLGAKVIARSFYVDDLLGGSNTLSEARETQQQLIQLLEGAGLHLRKWCANHSSLLNGLHTSGPEPYLLINELSKDSTTKTLGLKWNPEGDTFHFEATTPHSGNYTKRTILSTIASQFDPLGLIGPTIVKAKLLMKELWRLQASWDTEVPAHIQQAWSRYLLELGHLNQLSIPRRTPHGTTIQSLQLHGFCDASESAYGACVYTRSADERGEVTVNLLCSKNKVAPSKNISLPRLELCGALLLAQLYHKVRESINDQPIGEIHLWSDSTTALAWLAATSNTWKTFVANRVAEIQSLTSECHWRHVRGTENPADLLSRGAYPTTLNESSSWFHGPPWLVKNESEWPQGPSSITTESTDLEAERRTTTICLKVTTDEFDLCRRYSSLHKLSRVTAYCLRFAHNTKQHAIETRQHGPLTILETTHALRQLLQRTQLRHFPQELKCLRQQSDLPRGSRLRSLTPFIDQGGLLRVGGRIHHSLIQGKHPILLPSDDPITSLIIREVHHASLHSAPQALLSHVRLKYWPLRGKQLCNRIVRNCVRCAKARPRTIQPQMGTLPAVRVQPARPFLNVGVDYCGPILARPCARKRLTATKTYICLFICMATKAIHLELVTDLTTAGFIAALKRLFSRRGKSAAIYSDNATTFVGAQRELSELNALFKSEQHARRVSEVLAQDNISFHRIPARSPHFGGLWEAGVKSVKHHLRRAIGSTSLTYEELNTLIIQIEACVNSRPLTPNSNDPNDLAPLTPAHFLVGSSLLTVAEPDLVEEQLTRLSRWQRVQQTMQLFWRRWSQEYLTGLQRRSKWHQDTGQVQIGAMVLMKEEHRPPQHWPVGRIEQLHQGSDGRHRVAVVRTTNGLFTRAVTQLCPLPVDTQTADETGEAAEEDGISVSDAPALTLRRD